MKDQKFQSAEIEIRRELEKNPQSFDLNKILAINLLWQEKYNLAIENFNKCYDLDPKDYDININLALIFNKVQDYKSSLKFSKNAIEIDPDRPEAYHNSADSYLYIPDLEKAEECILKSIELRGGLESIDIFNFKDTLNIYTDILFSKGDEGNFKTICINLLSKGVFLGDIFRKLLRSDANAISNNHMNTLEDILKAIDKHASLIERNLTKANIYSCLGEFNQKLNKDLSEEYFIKSNKLINDLQRFSLYERQEYVKNIIHFFKNPKIEMISKDINPNLGDGLIFIIGMPRSGTTLVESIIATCDECVSGGEKVFFTSQCRPIIKQHNNGDLDYENFLELGKRYLDLIDIQRQGKKYFVDKFPENYLYYKFIKTSLPGAKFININRDPWDNAISLFKQYYVKEITYSSSFFGISLEYANYEHILKEWKSSEDHGILDISYEELVTDTNKVVDTIWKFCNLTGHYDASKRETHFAQTASKYQVRKRIYSSSLKKAEFVDFKEDFIQNLQNQRSFWSDN